MTKEQCSALIKAIQETAVFMYQNGVSVRNAISNTQADATYVAGLISDYSDAIEAIIADIPDDPSADVDNGGGGDIDNGGGGEG